VERLAATADGRVEVSGRWFGVRGRRFVRPALTLTIGDRGPERRCLAELEHKPWAAEDGQPWMAAFPVDVDLASASSIELSVAPDIEITLRSPAGSTGSAGESSVAAQARSPVAKQDARSRRPSARAQDAERLATRLAAAQAALEREHERRASIEQTLEEQRAEGRRLSAELGRVRAELDLAQTVQRESEAMSDELDSTRREMRAVEHRYEELVSEHDRAIAAHASVEAELRERSGALESARDALEQERARSAERLRTAQTQAATPPETAVRALPRDDDAFDDPEPTRAEPRRHDRRPERDPVPEVRPRPVAPHRTERPVNPALEPRPNWVWRVLALLVIIAVVVAVWLVLHSTILH
jgi:hypothetical protein